MFLKKHNAQKGQMSIKSMFGILLSVLVFVALIPTIATQFTLASQSANITGTASATLLVLGTLIVVVIFFYRLAKSAG